MKSTRAKTILAAVAIALLLVALFFVFDIREGLRQALNWIADLGYWAPLVFVLIYIVATICMVPGSILTLGAGFLFGLLRGTIVISIGATLGATAAFLISRYLARDWVTRKIQGREKFKAIDTAVGSGGWKIVFLTRLSPVFPFNLLNYAFGLTRVSFRDYFLSTLLGMLPATLLYVYIGSVAGSLAGLNQARERTRAEWILYGIGFLATVAVTVYVTRLAQRALRQKQVAT